MPATVILPYAADRTTAEDINRITHSLHRHDPGIRMIPFNTDVTPVALAEPLGRKTITVTLNNDAPSAIFEHVPGPKFFAPSKSKTQIVDDLVAAGIPMPHTEVFNPDHPPDEAVFGPYIAIKTTAPGTARAKGIYVFRTGQFAKLRNMILALYRQDMAAGHTPLLQQYIPTGPKPVHTRVTTFLGAPIVCFQTIAPNSFSPNTLDGLAGGEATSNYRRDRTRVLSHDPEMVELAKKVCAVHPQASVLSIDMVRCAETQKLYCLESNLGNLCVLSAPICRSLQRDLGEKDIHNQFGSYTTIARRMIETLDAI